MPVSPICPNCQMHRVTYIQDVTQHSTILDIDEEGNIDLGKVEEEIPHEEFHLKCNGCGLVFEDLIALSKNEGKEPEKK